mmetsp:Transcript_25830/g.80546  ORF Transcript_25830/g.80546 Transcript_25830/m.80546 type:complete len:238 (+) Transcript_25830:182-895(+)
MRGVDLDVHEEREAREAMVQLWTQAVTVLLTRPRQQRRIRVHPDQRRCPQPPQRAGQVLLRSLHAAHAVVRQNGEARPRRRAGAARQVVRHDGEGRHMASAVAPQQEVSFRGRGKPLLGGGEAFQLLGLGGEDKRRAARVPVKVRRQQREALLRADRPQAHARKAGPLCEAPPPAGPRGHPSASVEAGQRGPREPRQRVLHVCARTLQASHAVVRHERGCAHHGAIVADATALRARG